MFFEDGRTTIVIDNPTVEMNTALKSKFSSTVNEISTLLAPAEEKVTQPEVQPDIESQSTPSIAAKANDETSVVSNNSNYTSKPLYDLGSAFALIHNVSEMQKIGLDQTIIHLGVALGSDEGSVRGWVATATKDQKVEKYLILKSKVQASER